MAYQNISVELNDKTVDEIKESLKKIDETLNFLVLLTNEERKSLYKLGPKSIDFVKDANTVAQNYQQVLPANFDTKELAKDTNLYEKLSTLQLLINTLSEKINDTTMAVGSEAMKSSLTVYEYVKTASKTQAGLKSVAEQLQQRFKKQGKSKKETT